ncbi:glutathione S-transferase [Cercophora scortea]|uniref:glutathione transferase n=1 Tax=Cercophora scortea TaxID=314031 RepID=A0AAE0IV29_9PEZI|nr:glutathione S-transferase [Cercophora scortea]
MATNPPKPIVVWITRRSWVLAVFLFEELGLNYRIKSFRFDDVKKSPFIDVNPNGRVPAIQDPNTDITLWESGAIYQISSLLHRLTYTTLKEKHQCNQWLHFQMSGQGPYFGQCGWFQHLHPEKIPSAIERYASEIKRVLGVLEGVLAAKPATARWLVGDKMTFADMAFVPWNFRLSEVLVQPWDEVWAGMPHRAMEIRARLMDEQGLQWNGVPKGIETFTEYEAKIAARET